MKEFRCLIFSDQEVISAVVERRRTLRESLPVGTVRGVKHVLDPAQGVTLTIQMEDDYGKLSEVVVRQVELAAALVKYCLTRKIPMPIASSKTIEIIGNDVTLLMTMSADLRQKRVAAKGADAKGGRPAFPRDHEPG